MNKHNLEELINDLESNALTHKELHCVIIDLNAEIKTLNSKILSLETHLEEKNVEKNKEK